MQVSILSGSHPDFRSEIARDMREGAEIEVSRQNFNIFDFTLTEDDKEKIDAMNHHDTGTEDFQDPKFIKYFIETYS